MTTLVDLAQGSIFAGEFRVLRPLGAGAMGAVYAVQQWRTGHTRALKIMQPVLLRDAGMRARFLQEATVGARIKSDHIVHVVNAGVDLNTDTPWIAMELLEGADLGAVLAERGALPPGEVREIFAQLCHAVDAAHEASVVHRDLKPQNIFLAQSRRAGASFTVKVLDFGIAKLVAEADAARRRTFGAHPTANIGTPAWAAPEQAERGRPISPATDLWPLGLLGFTLLTGKSFWRAAAGGQESLVRLMEEIVREAIPLASDRASFLGVGHLLPPGFDVWFARCVIRDQGSRFARARDAAAGFEALFPEPDAEPAPHSRTPASQPRYGQGPRSRGSLAPAASRRILVIDDEPSDQLLIGHHLSQAGFTVRAASSGEEGIASAARDAPSLILLDFMLPDMDAPEVLRRLRAGSATRDIPVILLTGTDLASHIAEGFQAGANDYLQKPVEPRRLKARIEAAVAARERVLVASAIEDRHERLVADLEEARSEQEEPLSMLPARWNSWWAVGGVAQSGLVGGDLIALYEGPHGERTAVVVDVSGHGAGAALVGASVRAALGLLLRRYSPAEALAALNDELTSNAAPRHACVAVVQVKGLAVTVVNAGLPPVYVSRDGRPLRVIASSGVPPGLLPEQEYETASFTVATGDRITVVSDGLVEPFGLADDALPVLAGLGVFDRSRWTGREKPADVAELLREKLAAVAQPDDATLLLLQAGG